MVLINQASYQEFLNIEAIGKKTLPIYYNRFHLFAISIDNSQIYVAKDNDETVGFIVCNIFKNEDRIHIMSIGVEPEKQQKGYGTELINFIKNMEYNTVSLYVQTTNEKAVNFYKKNSFQVDKKLDGYYYTLEDKDAYYMIFNK